MSVAFQKRPPTRGMDPFIAFSKAPSGVEEIASSVVEMVVTSDERKIEVDENNNTINPISPRERPPTSWSSFVKEGCVRGIDTYARRSSGARSEFTDDEDSDTKHSEHSEDDALVICEDKCVPVGLNETQSESPMKQWRSRQSTSSMHTKEYSLAAEDKDPETVVVLEGFSHYFPRNLHVLHKRRLFCDVTVKAHNTMIHGHKVVLAACSPYFYKALEKNQSTRSQQKENAGISTSRSFIDLGTSVSPTGLETVIDSMYSSTIALRRDTVKEISGAAAHLDMQLVVAACLKFLRSRWPAAEDVARARNAPEEFSAPKREKESPIDLTASSMLSNATPDVGNEISDFKSDTEAFDSGNGREARSDGNSMRDPGREIIYQNVSHQNESDVRYPSPMTIERKHNKYVTKEISERTIAIGTEFDRGKKQTTSPDNKACGHYVTDEDDEVFIKKEAPRSVPVSADSGMQEMATDANGTPTRQSALSADFFRRELYQHMFVNSPYLLNAETMAAAVAMTTLTSPLRSPHNLKQMSMHGPERSPLIMNPWQHILGQTLHHSLPGTNFPRPPHLNSFPRAAATVTHADMLREQKMRQHALLNLASSAHGFVPGQPPPSGPDAARRRSNDQSPITPCSPLLLSSLLRASNAGPPQRMKRSYSVTPTERPIHMQRRFSSGRPAFADSRKSSRYFNSTAKDELESEQPRKRRSTNSSSGSPDRPYKCLVCAAEFNRPANLKTHMRIHSGEKPYKCQSCGARFVQVAHLRAHILIHTGEKPYPCKICGTRFRHLQTLKSHLRIHTGEKPYACEECQVRFRHKSQLRLHLRTKHGINTNTKKTYQQVPGLNNADINAHIKKTQEAVRMQAHRKDF